MNKMKLTTRLTEAEAAIGLTVNLACLSQLFASPPAHRELTSCLRLVVAEEGVKEEVADQ